MTVKALIFGYDEGFFYVRWNFIRFNQGSLGSKKFLDHLIICGDNTRDQVRIIALQFIQGGQVF